ncbi:hypothetical protein GCM10011399_18300 [Subtercola lobariae]|uniref:PABS domain-containing protein n=2 Tax=Subtercola lobariae TaxID=1588641 RepID=A0A917EWG3_9MICO|nr:hypothetical protein GCM10011399_18300 [Subtercola lobariae]
MQCAVERERELLEAVLREVPLNAEVTLLFGDAREIVDSSPTPAWGASSRDVTVIDLWAGAVIGARVASLEFYRRVAERVSDDGFVAVNLLDGPGFEYSRRQAATLQAVFAEVAVVLDERMLGNTELGNVVVLASNRPGAFAGSASWFGGASASSAREPFVISRDLERFIAGAAIVTDATACDSPPPDESHFNEHLGRPFFAA